MVHHRAVRNVLESPCQQDFNARHGGHSDMQRIHKRFLRKRPLRQQNLRKSTDFRAINVKARKANQRGNALCRSNRITTGSFVEYKLLNHEIVV